MQGKPNQLQHSHSQSSAQRIQQYPHASYKKKTKLTNGDVSPLVKVGREGWKGGKEEELNSVVSNSEKLLCDMHLGKIGDMSRSPCHHRPSFCCVAVRRALAFCVVAVPGR